MSRAPPLSHSYSSPKLGAAAIYSTSSPSGSPRPYFAQHLPGTMSPYRDASARYTHLGSPRISSLSRDATAALKGTNYPTSSSRPTSPAPGSRSPSPSSDSGDSASSSSSHGQRRPAERSELPERPLLTRGDSAFRRDAGPSQHDSYHDDPSASTSGHNVDSPSAIKRAHAHQLQPIDTKGEFPIRSTTTTLEPHVALAPDRLSTPPSSIFRLFTLIFRPARRALPPPFQQ